MFTDTRDAEPGESFGLSSEQRTDETTIIEVYLTDTDMDFARQNDLLAVKDPTVEGGIIVASPTSLKSDAPDIEREGSVTATPRFGDNQISRMQNGRAPIVYATAHIDGEGTSKRGTVIEFRPADEA